MVRFSSQGGYNRFELGMQKLGQILQGIRPDYVYSFTNPLNWIDNLILSVLKERRENLALVVFGCAYVWEQIPYDIPYKCLGYYLM